MLRSNPIVVWAKWLPTIVLLLAGPCAHAAQDGGRQEKKGITVWGDKPCYVSPYDIEQRGDWEIRGFESATQLAALTGPFHRKPDGLKPAEINLNVKEAGSYVLWVRSLDLAEHQQGERFFYVEANGKVLRKRLGAHGHTGFRWERVDRIRLTGGENSLRLIDSSAFYARCDGIFLTKDETMTTEGVDRYVSTDLVRRYHAAPLLAPKGLSGNARITDRITLENDQLTISFYQLEAEEHARVEITVESKGVLMKKRSDGNELILLSAAESQHFYDQGFPIFRSVLQDDGGNRQVAVSNNPYESFRKSWLVPHHVKKNNDGSVVVHYAADGVVVRSTWTLAAGSSDPLVRLALVPEKAGVYSVIIPSAGAFDEDEYTFALAPMRVANKRVHPTPLVYTEQYLFTPMATVSLPKGNAISSSEAVTMGLAVDPSVLELKWTYHWNNEFGALLRNEAGQLAPALIAPLPGSTSSKFDTGDTFEFAYRPIYHIGGWFDTYKKSITDVYGLKDYRKNYYSSITQAIFNTRDLMMDDHFGGWDSIGKAHWNMEGRSFSSNANPMQAVQTFLLTEDEAVLRKRAIPTLANLLTRGHLHFKSDTLLGGANYFGGKATFPRPIGEPIAGYNAPVFDGLYEMSGGRMPVLREIAREKSRKPVVNAYGSIPNFVNHLTRFSMSGDSLSLDSAINLALEYVDKEVYSTASTPANYSAFSYISYVPNIAALIDVYEATSDKRFLDAAEEAGRILLTQLWVANPEKSPMTDSMFITADAIRKAPFNEGHDFFWHGSEVWRLGSRRGVKGPPENLHELTDETVPNWLPSRVGLGLEQPSTFFNESLNMIMSSWVGDLMKLSAYTGEPLFAVAARNAIVGRFSNYPGYYQNRFITFQQKPEYPYKGPDFSSIYWHHIPPFLAMLEDFLFAQAQAWSGGRIYFPSLRQQGYAYFNANQYGHLPGSFFGVKEMWPWLDRTVLTVDDMQIDWLAARCDGLLGVALMNECADTVTSTVALGPKAGEDYTGGATLFYNDGRVEEVTISGGKLTLAIPGHTLVGLVVPTEAVRAPSFATPVPTVSAEVLNTVVEHDSGKGVVMQLSPDRYFGYIYTTKQPIELNRFIVDYRIGNGEERRLATDTYPFEFIIEVDRPSEPLMYSLTFEQSDGKVLKSQAYTLKPVGSENGASDVK